MDELEEVQKYITYMKDRHMLKIAIIKYIDKYGKKDVKKLLREIKK